MRITPTLLLCAIMLAFSASINASDYPYDVPCGEVADLKLSTENDKTFVLKWDEPKFKAKPTLNANESFAEVIFTVNKGYSIGKYDYTLSGAACLAMAEGAGEYNPLNNEYTCPDAKRTIRLLFKVKKDEAPFTLVYTYTKPELIKTIPVSQLTVQLDVVKTAEPAATKDDDKSGSDKSSSGNKDDDKKPSKKKDDDIDQRKSEAW